MCCWMMIILAPFKSYDLSHLNVFYGLPLYEVTTELEVTKIIFFLQSFLIYLELYFLNFTLKVEETINDSIMKQMICMLLPLV